MNLERGRNGQKNVEITNAELLIAAKARVIKDSDFGMDMGLDENQWVEMHGTWVS